MLTVIIINLNNLNNANKKQTATDKTAPIQVVITGEKPNIPPINQPQTALSPTSTPPSPTPGSCIREVGPVSILSPRENEVVVKDPICITLATESAYCSVMWSYKLDNGSWSDYTDKNICLHNLTNGNRTIQLKIKSTSSSDEVTLQRSFVYQGNTDPTATPTASSSASF
ncbi:MAG: hypothetical protein NTV98_01660 [Candidatus Roizmanbacteria bacterium]|nr:hypothetical protein [Candidatus Roizmanbacteria bacterium]